MPTQDETKYLSGARYLKTIQSGGEQPAKSFYGKPWYKFLMAPHIVNYRHLL